MIAMNNLPLSPEEAVFRAHIAAGPFRLGTAKRRWRLVGGAWPYPVFAVRASDGVEYGLRFDLTGYPRHGTARPWDVERDAALAPGLWPRGTQRIPLAFNPQWKGGSCLYLPCDRESISAHPEWATMHPSLIWDVSLGVVSYLRIIHDMLNSGDYGARHAA